MRYDADPRRAEILVQPPCLEGNASTVTTRGARQEPNGQDNDERLDPDDVRACRKLAAIANVPAPNKPDSQFSVKEIARSMSDPALKTWNL